MTLKSIRKEIDKGIHLNIINTEKFKTNLISFYIIRPLTKEEVTKNALIPLVLKRGTQKYNTSLEIQKKLEMLYGADLSINIDKKGERQLIRISIEAVNSLFIKEDNLLNDIMKIINEIVYNPYLENEYFSGKYVKQEKENLKKRIAGRINDKKNYAVERCIEEMCKNERYSIYKHGYIEDLENIDSRKLYDYYQSIIKTSPIEIFIVGNIEMNEAQESINNNFEFERGEVINIPREDVLKTVKNKNMVYENMDVKQGKLSIGLRTNIPYEDNLYEAFILASNILGGGANSKLFKNVREKESLAYYIYSKSYKYKSLLLIASGIDFENFDRSLEIIKNQINELQEGNFTDEEIADSKNAIITSVRSMKDSNYTLTEFYLSQSLTNDDKDVDQLINNIKNIKKEDIVNAAKKLSLDTIYFLRNKDE